MKYGIQATETGCDYTEFNTLEECKDWVLSNKYFLERDDAEFIQIINADDPDEVIFYDSVEWKDGKSNLEKIAAEIEDL